MLQDRAECCKIAQNVATGCAALQHGVLQHGSCCAPGGGGLDHAAQPRDESGVLGVLVPHCATGRSSQRSGQQTRVLRRVGAMTRYPRPHGMATARIPCGTVSPHWDTLRRRASHIGACSPRQNRYPMTARYPARRSSHRLLSPRGSETEAALLPAQLRHSVPQSRNH